MTNQISASNSATSRRERAEDRLDSLVDSLNQRVLAALASSKAALQSTASATSSPRAGTIQETIQETIQDRFYAAINDKSGKTMATLLEESSSRLSLSDLDKLHRRAIENHAEQPQTLLFREIVRRLSFEQVTTIEELRSVFETIEICISKLTEEEKTDLSDRAERKLLELLRPDINPTSLLSLLKIAIELSSLSAIRKALDLQEISNLSSEEFGYLCSIAKDEPCEELKRKMILLLSQKSAELEQRRAPQAPAPLPTASTGYASSAQPAYGARHAPILLAILALICFFVS